MKGFALVEAPIVAIIEENRVAGYGGGVGSARNREEALMTLQTLIRRGGVPPITRPGAPDIPWPRDTVITEVMAIRRLFGLSATREFHVYVEIDAPGRQALVEAFEYLEHYCGVEGYGGGG